MLAETIFAQSPPERGVFPNFGKVPGLKYEGYALVKIPVKGLKKLGEKFVRGMTYHLEKKYIEASSGKIEIFFTEDVHAAWVNELLDKYGETYNLGPGVVVKRGIPVDRQEARLFSIFIWNRFKTYATVMPPGSDAS